MKVSYSRISTFKQCPYQYYLKYIKGLKTKFNLDPKNALALGTAAHTGIEKNDAAEAIKNYYSNYPTATEAMVNEAIKLEMVINKANSVLPRGEYETNIVDDDFTGFIDLLVKVDENTFDLYDFKYSNNVKNYLGSAQLHLYKFYFEKLNQGKHIRNMFFVFIPKVNLKQEEEEDVEAYRKRLVDECAKQEIKIVKVDYDANKVIGFLLDTKHCVECKEFNKNPSSFCFFCDFKQYCTSNGKNDGNIIYPEEEIEDQQKREKQNT